jgi:CspA family cold shock protein
MSTTQETQRITGMVKWFNNKSGFGFITVRSEGESNGKDIFAHYSAIRVTNSQYKYLVQGEYVDFVLSRSDNEKHEFNAMDITGVLDGPILCETRRVATQEHMNNSSNKRSNKSANNEESVEESVEECVEESTDA